MKTHACTNFVHPCSFKVSFGLINCLYIKCYSNSNTMQPVEQLKYSNTTIKVRGGVYMGAPHHTVQIWSPYRRE